MQHPAADVAQHLQAHALPDDEIDKRIKHSDWVVGALAGLLQHGPVDHHKVLMVLTEALKQGIITVDELSTLMKSLPSDPAHLPRVMGHLHQVASHAGVMLKAEKTYRAMQSKKGT